MMHTRNLCLVLFPVLMFACGKSDSPGTPSPNAGKLKAIKIQISPKFWNVTQFDYDNQGRVLTSKEFDVDSTGTRPVIDSQQTIIYIYTNSNLPTGYVFRLGGTFSNTGTYAFDGNGRLLLDSTNAPASTSGGYTTRYQYSANQAFIRSDIRGTGGFNWIQWDTVNYSGPNIVQFSRRESNVAQWNRTTYTSAAATCPVYDLNIAPTLLLSYMGLVSRNLPATESYAENGINQAIASYTHQSVNNRVSFSSVSVSGIRTTIAWEYY
jgi:hypothetical protein